jgi:uncharacterized protein (TIGR00730 family)
MWDFYFEKYGSRYLVKDYGCDTTTIKITPQKGEWVKSGNSYEYIINDEKENTIMKGFNFDFGPVSDSVRMSIYGLAVKNKAGSYVSYNKNSNVIVDVDILNFNGSKFLYKMPVAIKDIAVGDIVVHQNLPMFVVEICSDNKALKVVDPVNGERKDIMLERSDVLVALPGGVGTLDEIFHVMAAATIGYHHKHVVLYNVNGFWNGLLAVLNEMNRSGFVRSNLNALLSVATDVEDLKTILMKA